MKKTLWGTTGIRGSAKELLTNQFVYDMGRSFALFLKKNNQKGKVVVGRDPRQSSPRIAKALVSGILSEGIKIVNAGIVPIPAVNRALLDQEGVVAGVMVTGSHIEKSLNGLKFFAFEEEILKEHEYEIEKIYYATKEKKGLKLYKLPKINLTTKKDYMYYLIECAVDLPRWRVVVDPGNGAQTESIVNVLKNLGLRVLKLNASLSRPMLARDTEREEDFAVLKKKVCEAKADFGIGFDSDGDRVIFCDEAGQIVYGDYLGALIARHKNLQSLVVPVNTSLILEKITPGVIRTKVGSAYVVSSMRHEAVSFGFESNGGMVFSPMLTRDGGRAAIEVMNIMAQRNMSLSMLIEKLPSTIILKDKIKYDWDKEKIILGKVREKYKGKKISEIDGLKIFLSKNSWILFRSSRNSPEFRIFVEAPTEKKARQLLSEGLQLVNKYA